MAGHIRQWHDRIGKMSLLSKIETKDCDLTERNKLITFHWKLMKLVSSGGRVDFVGSAFPNKEASRRENREHPSHCRVELLHFTAILTSQQVSALPAAQCHGRCQDLCAPQQEGQRQVLGPNAKGPPRNVPACPVWKRGPVSPAVRAVQGGLLRRLRAHPKHTEETTELVTRALCYSTAY